MAAENDKQGHEGQDESDSDMRQRLVNSLSQSFPGSALSRALKLMDPLDECDGDLGDPLNSSCFAEIHMEKEPIDDDELTSLSWLQDSDLLKNINAGEEGGAHEGQKENNDGIKLEPKDGAPQMHPPHVPYNPQKHINSKPPYSFSCLIFMAIEDSPQKRLPVKDIYSWILTHFPYFQNAPTGWKNSVRHNLSLNKCFKKVDKEKGQSIGKGSLWCIDPEYRPNLLQALKKTPYHPYHQLQMLATPQPSNQYAVSGAHRPLPLTTRININTPSPHLFPFLSKRLAQSKLNSELDIDVANTLVSLKGGSGAFRASENPRLKPLTPLYQNGTNGRNYRERSESPPEFGSEKYQRRRFSPYSAKRRPGSPIVYTSSPSEDHTYSVSSSQEGPFGSPDSARSSIDEEYEFGHNGNEPLSDVGASSDGSYHSDASDYDESDAKVEDQSEILQRRFKMLTLPVKKRYSRVMQEEEEAAKIVEGADALLNLAGIKTSRIVPLRSISPMNNNNSIVIKKEMDVSS